MTRADVGHPMTNPVTLTEGMRERVARALLAKFFSNSNDRALAYFWTQATTRGQFLGLADAVITSLGLGEDGENVVVPKESTEKMVKFGHAAGARERAFWLLLPEPHAQPIEQDLVLRLLRDYLPAAYRAMLEARPDA